MSWLPRSSLLKTICHRYVEHCDSPSGENNGDPERNGEYRFLRVVGPRLGTVFDVGANRGDWTAAVLATAPRVTRVVAFEPWAPTFAKLSARDFPSHVVLEQAALSSEEGKATLHGYGTYPEMNSFHSRTGIQDYLADTQPDRTEQVATWTLDGYCQRKGIERIDFLKVDTEGHEWEVLQGARKLLANGSIGIIQFEYGGTYIDSRRLLKDVFELLTCLGYCLHKIVPRGLVACPAYSQRLENFQYKNFIAVHPAAERLLLP